MSCKFDKEICNGLVSIVFTSVTIKKVWLPDRQTHAHTDRRRTKWSLCADTRLTCLPSLIKKSTTVKSLLCSQAYFHRCPVWPWPLTSKINRQHPLITVNMSCKFDKEICNGLVSMVFTSVTIKKVWLPDRQTHAHTDRRRTKWSLCADTRLTCLPSLIKKSTTVKSLLCSQAYFHRCPVWPWPLTSDLQNQ